MAISPDELRSLSAATGLDLAIFRPEHLEARVARALVRSRSLGMDELRSALSRDMALREEFRRSIAISVTGFFRDAEQFDLLSQHLGALKQVRHPRVWSAGCSNGSELWSMAILLNRLGLAGAAQMLGSDLLDENVRRARAGLDRGTVAGHVLPADARPIFEQRDLVLDPTPPGKWNVILCRNVAIYFGPVARAAVHAKLVDALAPDGLLLLGRSERLDDPRALGVERVAPHLYRKS